MTMKRKTRIERVYNEDTGWFEPREVECIALSDIDESVLNNRAAETEKITGKKVKHL